MSEIIEDLPHMTLAQLCRGCGANADLVIDYVEAGILDPEGKNVSQWRFSQISIIRLQKARRLQSDLNINLQGVALALDLLDEIDRLRAQIKSLEN